MVQADPVNTGIVLSIITYRKRRRRNLYVNKYSNVNNKCSLVIVHCETRTGNVLYYSFNAFICGCDGRGGDGIVGR